MPTSDLQQLDAFVANLPERAARFAEGGVAVPFTTPLLAAARLRLLPGRPAELLLPALGGRGTYVLGWEACRGLSPTLHDRGLWKRLRSLPAPSPARVRDAAREVAAEGLAGRAAQAAARAALQSRRTIICALEARFAALGPAAARLVEALADTEADGTRDSLIDSRIAALSAFAEAATAQALAAPVPADRETARLVASAAQLALAAGRASLATLRKALEALPPAKADAAAVARIAGLAARPDWLLDGWCRPATLCRLASAGQSALLRDTLAALPVPPIEAEEWWPSAGGWDAVLRGRARLGPGTTRPTEARVEQVARLEALRAMAA